jgi:hypothetical protein
MVTMHQRVRRFLAVEIASFVDLTEAQERIPYFPFLLAGVSEGTCPPADQRLPICDWDVPTPAMMVQILDAIATAVAEGLRSLCRGDWAHWGRVGDDGRLSMAPQRAGLRRQ